MPLVNAVFVAYNNAERVKTRWFRDVSPALFAAAERIPGLSIMPTCVDHSPEPSEVLKLAFRHDYFWRNGANEMYGGGVNFAVRQSGRDDYFWRSGPDAP